MATLKSWYPDEFGEPPIIEPLRGFRSHIPFGMQAVSLLSGGIDSLATLRWNRLHLPADHPFSIHAVLLVSQDKNSDASAAQLRQQTQTRLSAVSDATADANVDPIPVRTNLWWLAENGYFYDEKWHGALLASVACFFSRRFQKAYIASSYEPGVLHPWGSHPLLDPYYSAAHFQVEHHGLAISRFEKTALIAEWPAGLNSIRVCQNDDRGGRNCGTCEKCLRTMTALVALGRLEDCRAFPARDVSPELLSTVGGYLRSKHDAHWYKELIPALLARGRDDLAATIRSNSRQVDAALSGAVSTGTPVIPEGPS